MNPFMMMMMFSGQGMANPQMMQWLQYQQVQQLQQQEQTKALIGLLVPREPVGGANATSLTAQDYRNLNQPNRVGALLALSGGGGGFGGDSGLGAALLLGGGGSIF